MDKKIKKDNFLIYHNTYAIVKILSDENKGKLLDSLYKYTMDGEIPSFENESLTIVFEAIKSSIDISNEKYYQRCMKNIDNINKRWRKIFIDNTSYTREEFNKTFPKGYGEYNNFDMIYNTQSSSSFASCMEEFNNTLEIEEEFIDNFKKEEHS